MVTICVHAAANRHNCFTLSDPYMSKGYRIHASTGIHRGDRDYQQDQVCLLHHARIDGCLLGVVADGMGGRSGGRKASDQVMLTTRQLFDRFDPQVDDPSAVVAPDRAKSRTWSSN